MLVRITAGPLTGRVVDMSTQQAAHAVRRGFAERESHDATEAALPHAPRQRQPRRRRLVLPVVSA